MRNTVIWSFLSLVALGAGGLISGCDSDAKLSKSALGDSCDKTADCDDGLKCVQNTCYKSSTSSGGSANNEGGDGTGATPPAVVPPVLGDEGESCTKRADCKDGLGCFSQRCTKSEANGEGGEGNTPSGPTLGGIGETCGLTSDCTKGLACLPNDGFAGARIDAIGSNSVGVCSPTSFGLEPTGKTCGAECLTATDCCELPVELHATLAANSCTELADLLDGVKCETAVAGTLAAERCFAQSAYCECTKTTWACNDGACHYTAACSKAALNTPEGCPSYSRSGVFLGTPCDTTGSKKCEPEAAAAGCKTDANCDAKIVADSPPLAPETCAAGECTCYKATGACYRKCGEDLDCPPNYACDTKTTVCVPNAACTTDVECVVSLNDINGKCFDGMCDRSCSNDLDCNFGVIDLRGIATRVCNADKRCEAVGCSTDDQCPAKVGNGVRLFCAKPAVVAGTAAVHSAITD